MKKFLLSAAALVAAMSVNAQVFQMDAEAHGLTSDLSTVAAGYAWGSIEGAVDISNAFETDHKMVDCKMDDFTKVIIDGNEILTKGGVQGNDNPKDADGSNPAVTFIPAVSGAVIQLDAKKDGWVYIVAKLSTNKQYMVFEEGLPIGYKIAIESNNEAVPGGVLNLEIKGEGEYNNLSLDMYPGGLKWLIREFTGNAEAESAGNGLGVFYFPVAKDCKYLASATGSKITWCGVYFSESEAQSVTVEGDGVSRNLIGDGSSSGNSNVIWENTETEAVSWNGVYRFCIEGQDYNNECIAQIPQATWDKMKTTPFFMDLQSENPQIRITTGWWDDGASLTAADIQPGNELLTDNGDGTWTVKVNLSANATLIDLLDSHHLLFTGDRYVPIKLYFGNATAIQAVKNVQAESTVIYNLAGQRVDANYKGVVIVNGQKKIQK